MYFFYSDMIHPILKAMEKRETTIRLSLDLNLSEKEYDVCGLKLVLDENSRIDREVLKSILSHKNKVYGFENGEMRALEVRADAYCKLVATKGAPTLEIDGIKMHRSKGIDPLSDAKQKTRLVVRPRDIVLDTCGGLGYSAIFALKAGASRVVSFEKSKAVMQLRSMNPWLIKFASTNLEFRRGDSTKEIFAIKDQSFHSIIHDPPRFTSATGDLYGKVFYDGLYRVLAPGGRLFHYTGSPKRVKAQDRFIKNTITRLANSGFQKLVFHDHLQGIYGEKH